MGITFSAANEAFLPVMILAKSVVVCPQPARNAEPANPSGILAPTALRSRVCIAAALVAIAALTGCGGGSQQAPSGDEAQIRAALKVLGMEYGGFLARAMARRRRMKRSYANTSNRV